MPFAYVIREAYEPGNATCYELLLTHERGNLWTFSWLNAPRYGRSCTLNRSACLHVNYLAEKLGHDNEADLVPILRWLATQDFDVHTPTDS